MTRSKKNKFRLNIYYQIALEMNEQQIPHSILSGIDYNKNQCGRDLDLMIHKNDISQVEKIIGRILSDYEVEFRSFKRRWARWILGFSVHENQIIDIEIDLMWNIICRGRQLTDNGLLSWNEMQKDRFWSDEWNPFVKMFFTQFISRRFINFEKRWDEIFIQYSYISDNIRTRLQYLIGISAAEELSKALADKDRDKIIDLGRNQKRMISWGMPYSGFFSFIRSIAIQFTWKLDDIFSPPLLPDVSISGPDGVGKSSVINNLKEQLEGSVFTHITIKHWRPALLPNINDMPFIRNIRSNQQTHATSPPRRVAGAFGPLRIAYYLLDFLAGYLLKDLKLRNQLDVLIYDRHYIDMIIDPERFGISPKYRPVLFFFIRLLPLPEIMIIFNDEPSKIIRRKQELTSDDIIRQSRVSVKIAKKDARVVLVKMGTIEETAYKIARLIYERCIHG